MRASLILRAVESKGLPYRLLPQKRYATMPENSASEELLSVWSAKQVEIASKVKYEDDNSWGQLFSAAGYQGKRNLFIAGADISFSTLEEDFSVGTLAIVKLSPNGDADLVYSCSKPVNMQHPYVPSFLGFREAPIVSEMLHALPLSVRNRIDCLLIDGNGVLHPRKAGLACQVGVQEDIPTVGVSKTLLCVDELDEREVRNETAAAEGGMIDVVGKSNFVWAKALLTGNAKKKPIYVSVGHRVSLPSSAQLVRCLCEYRIPAPIRFADMNSRALLRGETTEVFKEDEFLYTDS